jgi:hypothetical protein
VKVWWLLALVGCDHPSSHPVAPIDAAPIGVDGDPNFCDVSATSGHAALTIGGTSRTFSRVYAGGVIAGGGQLAPGDGPPLTPMLLFTDDARLPEQTLYCCSQPAQPCCTIDGAIANADTSAIGTHPVRLTSFQDSAFMAEGTITITDYTAPFQSTPSRIAGSIVTTSTGDSVNATFDTNFCELLLEEPI